MANKFLFLLQCLFLLIFVDAAFAQVNNTDISNGIGFDGEPYLEINPKNSQNIVAAWMGMKFSNGAFRIAIKSRASFDGGNTWSAIYTFPHFATKFGSADPSMAFDKNGFLYLSYIDYQQVPDSGGIYISRSKDGGLNWDTPNKVFDMYEVAGKRPIDRPWLVIDNSNKSSSGTLYITTKPAPWIPAPNRNYFKASIDSGKTWTSIANVDGGTNLVGNLIAQPMATPTVTRNGKFCAIYPSYVISQNLLPAYYCATSMNKGQSFTYSMVIASTQAPTDTNFKIGYRLLASPLDSNKMVFLLPRSTNGDLDIFLFNSADGGQTWSNPVRVNDDSIGNGKAQDLAWIAYNEKGNILVTWRDRRNSNTNGFWNAGYDFYYSISEDDGKTFKENKKISTQFISFDSVLTENGNDMMGCVYSKDTAYTLWGDTRNGKLNIYFSKMIVSTNKVINSVKLDGEKQSCIIYPNPSQDIVNIDLTEEGIGKRIELWDAQGKRIKSISANKKNQIATAHLQNGLYYLIVIGEKESIREQIIIQK